MALAVCSFDTNNLLLPIGILVDKARKHALGLSENEFHTELFAQESSVDAGLNYISWSATKNLKVQLLVVSPCLQW